MFMLLYFNYLTLYHHFKMSSSIQNVLQIKCRVLYHNSYVVDTAILCIITAAKLNLQYFSISYIKAISQFSALPL